MGTSVSFRSPSTPRWNAVLARIKNGAEASEVRAELFNAGFLDGWATELSRPTIGFYVDALVDAHGTFAERLAASQRPEHAIQDLVDDVRRRALAEDNVPALAIVERALTRTLVTVARGEGSLSGCSSDEVSATWRDQRGKRPHALLQRFLGEVLHQYTAHVIGRDAGQLLGPQGLEQASQVRRLERAVADNAREVAETVSIQGKAAELPSRWEAFVTKAFRSGAALPKPDG